MPLDLASLTFIFLGILLVEVLIASIISIDEKGHAKLTLARGLSPYKKTSFVISVLFIIVLFHWLFTEIFRSMIQDTLRSMGLRLIPLFIAIVSTWVFWTTKFFLGRRWQFNITLISITVAIISFFIWSMWSFFLLSMA